MRSERVNTSSSMLLSLRRHISFTSRSSASSSGQNSDINANGYGRTFASAHIPNLLSQKENGSIKSGSSRYANLKSDLALMAFLSVRFSEFCATLRTLKEPDEQRSTRGLCRLHLPSFSGFTDLGTTLWTFGQIEHTPQNKTRRTNVLTSCFFFDDLHYRETVHIRIGQDSAALVQLPTSVQRISKEKDGEMKTAE
jgi:hypothetical protein